MDEFGALAQRLGYRFHNPDLLRLSLTHKSHANENPTPGGGDYERLEFLGDAVLDFVVSDLLVAGFTDLPEGDLSKIRANLVSEPSLAEIARELGLARCLLIGKGEALSGGRDKDSILADALEAVFAAVYLDGAQGGDPAGFQQVIRAIFQPRLTEAEQSLRASDFKTELQELVQKRYKETVLYRIVREAGPDHDKQFEAAVVFREREFGRGSGRSKKIAEQAAAQNTLAAILNGTAKIGP